MMKMVMTANIWFIAATTFLSPSGTIKKMKKYKVTFVDEIEAENEEDAYHRLIVYLQDVVQYEDVTAFEFEEIKENDEVS